MKFLSSSLSLLLICLLLFISCTKKEKKQAYVISKNLNSSYTEQIQQYYFKVLDSATFYINKIDTTATLNENKLNFLQSRKWYKKVEPLMIAYDYENYLSINAPNLLKIEADDYTEIKKFKPKSYQVLEEYLYSDDVTDNKEFHRVYSYVQARLPFIKKNHIIIKQKDSHHLKMIRDAIINIATKGVTGFDSPMLANSLQEAIYNYETLSEIISIFERRFTDRTIYNEWKKIIRETISYLGAGNFDTFDRYNFIKSYTHPQLQLINETANDWNVTLNTSRPLNPKATNLFSKDFFNVKKFALPNSLEITPEIIALGKQLFNDTSLSKTSTISCATCHVSSKAFTDGKTLAVGANNTVLSRNTPTLAYAVYQKSFFYDGRSAGLEDQIVNVANNKDEFHIDLNTLVQKVKRNPEYFKQFNTLYKGKITDLKVRNAIATYIRSLTPFDSKFDRNMQNLENTLTLEEKKGFNLFMGKAACATCHFPPAFYGTVPPKFDETEFENLGITKTDDLEFPILDNDPGLFFLYEIEEKRGFFKTSTVRNTEITAPYMHNGAYKTLDKVLDFYNNGGGAGMKLKVPYQTLPVDSLHLNKKEISAIIAFIKTLTDRKYEENRE